MELIRISVRRLVEFILRAGDIESGGGRLDRDAMQLGSRLHRKIQKMGKADYRAEVPLKMRFDFPDGHFDEDRLSWKEQEEGPAYEEAVDLSVLTGEMSGGEADGADTSGSDNSASLEADAFSILLEGRADGIIEKKDGWVIDEIKGMRRDIHELEGPLPLHEAQASCYAYIYLRSLKEEGSDPRTDSITVQMTYANLETEEIRRFCRIWQYRDLENWFLGLLREYHKWALWLVRHGRERQISLKKLEFPFPYREGQRKLAGAVYRTIERQKKIFIQAPTGSGKTVATVFPALKAMGEGYGDKLFYLTARTVARTVAEECFSLLKEQGLCFFVVTITAKEKVCPMMRQSDGGDPVTGPKCDPALCPRAKGHFDRVNEAVYSMLTENSSFSREDILRQAEKYSVCPFEMTLDLTDWTDGIICDYNYLFDPTARLQRFFGQDTKGDHIFLIDEAHNLVDRGRDMYSADLSRDEIRELRRELKKKHLSPGMVKALDALNKWMLAERRLLDEKMEEQRAQQGAGQRERDLSLQFNYRLMPDTGTFPLSLLNFCTQAEKYLEEAHEAELTEQVMAFYFRVLSFLDAADRADGRYVTYSEILGDKNLMVRIFCVDPGADLEACMGKGRAAVLFSATLLPISYYRRLLSVKDDDYAIYASSSFDPGRRRILIGTDTSTRYTRRGPMEYQKIASYIRTVVSARRGNYIAFFPSYRMMEDVEACFEEICPPDTEILMQNSHMTEKEREEFLDRFSLRKECGEEKTEGKIIEKTEEYTDEKTEVKAAASGDKEGRSLAAFCVMGSIFGEGIDLRQDSLIGVIIAGTGLPQVSVEREILRFWCAKQGLDGFYYAYICPGMNKVMQAAGRVIRTEEDMGVVLLLDERFGQNAYRSLFPAEWRDASRCSRDTAGELLREFWDKMGEKRQI